jgi:hypothetical protein
VGADVSAQERPPNFRDDDGRLYLVRCFNCSTTDDGRENWAMSVAAGQCAWCGWKEHDPHERAAVSH